MEEVPVPRPGPGEVLVKVNRFFFGSRFGFLLFAFVFVNAEASQDDGKKIIFSLGDTSG